MAELDEESYLDSLLGSIGDVEDIVTTKEMGVEKILENQLSKEDNDNVIDEPEEKEADKAEEPEVKEAESAEPEQSMDIDAISADELNSLLGKESEAPAADNTNPSFPENMLLFSCCFSIIFSPSSSILFRLMGILF